MTSPEPSQSSSRPFAAAPNADRYYAAVAIEEARQRITRSIRRGEGPVLLVGAAGLGKTLLLEVIARQFSAQLKPVLLVGGQLCTRRALLQMILFQLGLPYKEMDESELRLALIAHLRPADEEARRLLLLVDEADALPQRLLEELRALTNLATSGQVQVNLVLAGSSQLEEQFADPKLHLFSQRVSGRCYLSPFGREETFRYIQAQVAASGQDPQAMFTDDGLEAIFAATDGAPRLVNQLGDQLMWMVEETGYSPLDSAVVQQAWSELQQLPAPWNTQAKETVGGTIEYGDLECGDLQSTDIEAELTLADDAYADEFDEELPASIPMNFGQAQQVDAPMAGEDTLDFAEQLLDDLEGIDITGSPTVEVSPSNATPARNPFAETFDSEEVVLDRYSTFETLLLASAPRVENCTDTGFSQQLQLLEAHDAHITPLAQIAATTADSSECVTVVDTCDTEGPLPHTTAVEIGDVLVIDEDGPSDNVVVNGQKFRQLFSSLENAAGGECFG